MPKKAIRTKKPTTKKLAPTPAPEAPTNDVAPRRAAVKEDTSLAIRFAVLEDVVRRAAQETRAFGAKLDTFAASQTELARRVAAVEQRAR